MSNLKGLSLFPFESILRTGFNKGSVIRRRYWNGLEFLRISLNSQNTLMTSTTSITLITAISAIMKVCSSLMLI